jgi:hypothetical protein
MAFGERIGGPRWCQRFGGTHTTARDFGVEHEPDALAVTVERFNADVRNYRDTEFGRGDNTYDIFWGDRTFEGVHRTLGVIDTAPFYAVKIESGVLGTCGGPRPNADCQVIDWNDQPIEDLYVCSNAMSSSTAGVYGGADGTLGPGMTFGFIAGRHTALKG